MGRLIVLSLFTLTVALTSTAIQVQMPDSGLQRLEEEDPDLQSQVQELQRNLTELWTYIYELRSAVTKHLTQLSQHQDTLEAAVFSKEDHAAHSGHDDHHGSENCHQQHHDDHHGNESGHQQHHDDYHGSESGHHHHQSEDASHGDMHDDVHHHHDHSGEQHSHGGDDQHSHGTDDHHSHGSDDHHSHGSDDQHSHGSDDHHSHGSDDHHSHGDDNSHSHGDSHHHHSDSHSHGDDDSHSHGDSHHSDSHSHSHGNEHSSTSDHHSDEHGHHHHDQDSHKKEDGEQQVQQNEATLVEPLIQPVVHQNHHHHHSSRGSGSQSDPLSLTDRHTSASRRSNQTTFPKFSEYRLYDFAICNVRPNSALLPEDQGQNVNGEVSLWQKKAGGPLSFHVHLHGFKVDGGHHASHQQQQQENEAQHGGHRHGFHVHAYSDFSNGCQSTGPHYNPKMVDHGGPNALVRHVGDLGNIECDEHGVTNILFNDEVASLTGQYSIVGKSIVIHSAADDLGSNPNDPESLRTGNSGSRLACCVVESVEKLPLRSYKAIKKATQYQNR